MSVSEPSKILTPWATSGLKNTIPSAADPVTGKAGYDQGFPAINMTAKEAGGIPPFGQDFNGIFFDITQILQYMQAGGLPTYSSTLSAAIGGYPLGAILLKSNGLGLWRNTVASNTSNPDAGGAGWISDSVGSYANATVITAASTSLAAAQAGQAFLFSAASSTCQLPTASSVSAGGVFKIETSSGLTLSVTGGTAFQAGNSSVTSLAMPAGTEAVAVSTGAAWWVFGSATNAALGVGQTWTDVTASRVAATNYYNTTGRPIYVSVINQSPDGGLSISVDGITIASSGAVSPAAGDDIHSIGAVVPPGSRYLVTILAGTISKWVELR